MSLFKLRAGIVMPLLLTVITCVLGGTTGTDSDNDTAYDMTLFVDGNNANASDANDGTEDSPLLTIQRAVDVARTNKRGGVSTAILIEPGIYREKVTFAWTNRPENQPDNNTPILVSAVDPGTVRITGSDIWTDWTEAGDGELEHEWTFDWGEFDPGWDLDGLAARREMVFVNGALLKQVESVADLDYNMFAVDESGGKLRVKLDAALLASAPVIEVAVRDVVWDQRYENNVTLDGIRFDHAATPWKGGQGAVRITSSAQITIRNCVFEHSNWAGLYIGESAGVELDRLVMNHNGGQGWSTWRVSGFSSADTETSFNNWRGKLSDFTGWSVGNKLESMHGVRIVRHRAVGNYSRGLWLDYDIQDAVLDSLFIASNERDGVWLEANSGPITISNSTISGNGTSGLRTTFTENVTLIGNRIEDNEVRQLEIAGEDRRWVQDFVTGERKKLTVSNWKLRGNVFSGGKQLIGVANNHKYKEWTEFITTLDSDDNSFVHENLAVFLIRTKTLSLIEARSLEDFQGWQEHTGQDTNSSFQVVNNDM